MCNCAEDFDMTNPLSTPFAPSGHHDPEEFAAAGLRGRLDGNPCGIPAPGEPPPEPDPERQPRLCAATQAILRTLAAHPGAALPEHLLLEAAAATYAGPRICWRPLVELMQRGRIARRGCFGPFALRAGV
jgi:hypothetical protein